ncbi:MAG: hypothetical protein IPG10_02300 [Flavobacteriales bacterium]|nr:hypothetical protein [Flavobacteriales bacterium]MBK7085766.1 hypothetical protein [Flavobacteriales bacterium]
MDSKKHQALMTVGQRSAEPHPGQTAEHGPTHDQRGSQIESERHQYPTGNIPKAGSERGNKRPRIKRSGS